VKIIVPVAGIGSRLAPHTYTVPKALVQVAGKPMLSHIIDKIKDFPELSEVVFVVGYLGNKIVDFIEKNYDFKAKFVFQKERKGLGHAIYVAMNRMDNLDEPVLIMLGDTLFEMDLTKVLIPDVDGAVVTSKVENPERFGVVVSESGKIKELVEKPEKFVSNRAIIGIYCINNTKLLHESLKFVYDNDIKTRGEYQLTDALALMLKKGAVFTDVLCPLWLDCGKPETLLDTNRKLLSIYFRDKEYDFKNAVIKKPVAIADGVVIENSVVGPNVSIASGVKIKNSVVRESIINKDAILENALLSESLIGENALFKNRYNKVNVGDSSEFIS